MLGPRASSSPDNVVVVALDYNRRATKVTISFSSPRPDHGVLGARACMVNGVDFASSGNGPGPQELELYLTAYYAENRASALTVVWAIIAALGLTVKGEINIYGNNERTSRPRRPRPTARPTFRPPGNRKKK